MIEGTVFLDSLFSNARDLIEDSKDSNPEYTRGIIELLHDVTGMTIEAVQAELFPPQTAFIAYALDVMGDNADEGDIDHEYVAKHCFDELTACNELLLKLNARETVRMGVDADAIKRTVTFYEREGDEDTDGYYRYQYDVIMDWAKDGDQMPRSEIGHGRTQGEAWASALAIAAAFMYEDHVDSESWPNNNIDRGEPPVGKI